MRYPKPWQIGKVKIDPPNNINTPRMSTIEIIDADEKRVCLIRTYSQPIAQDIINAINEYDQLNTVKQCADCLYYTKDMLSGYVQCKFPKECHNKHLFSRKEYDI